MILARKPIERTVAANVQAHGTGALNIDGCRIGLTVETWPSSRGYSRHDPGSSIKQTQVTGEVPSGRWPANVLLDEEAARLVDEQTGDLSLCGGEKRSQGNGGLYEMGSAGAPGVVYSDPGGASRFFYTSKASRAEREIGLEGGARKAKNWSSGEQSPGTFQSPNTDRTSTNHHPTVKPLDLMRWLCRLITPPGGVILDPFCGSGTTGMAALEEGFGFIGIELQPEYLSIAEQRIRGNLPLLAQHLKVN